MAMSTRDEDSKVVIFRNGAVTTRDALVLQLLALGYSPRRIASLLHVPTTEVARRERSACAALGAQDLWGAVLEARRLGLILPVEGEQGNWA